MQKRANNSAEGRVLTQIFGLKPDFYSLLKFLSKNTVLNKIMSSIKFRDALLIAFAIMFLLLGSISAYEFVQVDGLNKEISRLNSEVEELKSTPPTTYTTTATIMTTTMITSTVAETTYSTTFTSTVMTSKPMLPDEGSIILNDVEDYAYKRIETFEEGSSIIFRNVNFTNLKHNATETYMVPVFFIKVTFRDGVSEVIKIFIIPLESRPLMYFTIHSPKAGIIISNGNSLIVEGFYLMVEER